MRRPLAVALGLGAVLAAVLAAETDEPPVRGRDSRVVLAELQELCAAVRASDDDFYGTSRLVRLESWLAGPQGPVEARVLALAQLALELLREGGREREAVERLDAARRLAEEAQLAEPLRRDILRQLALAWLRLGERENCVATHGPASCIFPLTGEAVHAAPEGARTALRLYREYAARFAPPEPVVIWLMNVAAMAGGDFPDGVPEPYRIPAARLRPTASFPRFPNVARSVGLDIERPSGGALLDDFDGDGRLDLLTTTIDPCRSALLFHNAGGGRFVERTRGSGLEAQLGGLNAIHADYDNDGDNDVLVLRGGWMGATGRMRKSLLRNDGRGRFEDVTHDAGLAEPAYPTQTGAWADFDGDGWLDLYVGNEADDEGRAYPSQLFRNLGNGRFAEMAARAGVTNERLAKGVAWGDADNDGDADLYVSNLGPNRLYRNDGNGRFTDVAEAANVVEPRGRSFATWFFDFDNDGWLDIFVADYGSSLDEVALWNLGVTDGPGGRPRLHRNRGDGTFEDVGRSAGLVAPCLPMGANFGDLDNDGFLDLYLGTGSPSYESIAPNLMYRNDGGRRFEDVTLAGGFGQLQKGHGVAFGDLDDDGDQDVVEQLGGAYPGDAYPSALFQNPGAPGSWISLQLEGRTSNRSAIGARLVLTVGGGSAAPESRREIHALVGTGGSFGGSSLRQEIGLGAAERVERLEVRWPPPGAVQVFHDIPARRFYRLREGARELESLAGQPAGSENSPLSRASGGE
jgi:hypothetical protein